MISEKSYNIEIEDRGDHIWVLVGGKQLTAAISVAYWNEIAQRCRSGGYLKILIEKEFPESVGPLDMVEMAEHLGKVLPGHKIAFFDRYGHESINELGKKLARNRDVLLQVFKSVTDAEKWLRAN